MKYKTGKTTAAMPFFFMVLIYSAFISLGIPDGLLGVAWPHIRRDLGINIDAIGLLLISGTAGYLVSSFYTGRMTAILSISGLLALSCALTGISLIIFCFVPFWFLFVITGFFLGFGAGGIDAGLNTYVASELSSRHMHWLHAFYGVGITAGPFIITGGLIVFKSWKAGYAVVAAVQLLLSAAFFASMKSWKTQVRDKGAGQSERKITDYDTPVLKTLSEPKVWGGITLFFLYTGAEVSLGLWAYSLLTEDRGVDPTIAGLIAGSFYAMFTAGRIASGFYSEKFSAGSIAKTAIAAAVTGSLLLWLNINTAVSTAGLVIAGFAIAPVFPALVSETKNRVGDSHAGNAIGMQMSAASLGQAVIPAVMGILAAKFSPGIIPAAITVLFVIILVFMSVFLKKKVVLSS